MSNLELDKSVSARRWALIIWPAFLAACLLEAVVFSVVDPGEVHWSGLALQPTRQAVYTLAFFCFWLIAAVCSYVVLWLAQPDRALSDSVAAD